MVTAPSSTPNKRGPRSTADWEKLRAAVWAHEVQRLAQQKMAERPWDAADLFIPVGKLIAARWATPQRQTQSHGIVTMNDLSETALGSGRTDFYRYASGKMARPQPAIVNAIDQVLPGTQKVFDVGPEGVPLWAVLEGNITVDDFWVPLAKTGQISDALELLAGHLDWAAVETTDPIPALNQVAGGMVAGMFLRDAIKFEAKHFLPTLPLSRIVRGLVFHLARKHFQVPDPVDFNASMIETKDVNLGMATLAIAVAQLAIDGPHDLYGPEESWDNPDAPPDGMHDLRELLLGTIPFWKQFDDANGNLEIGMVHTATALLAKL